MKSQDGNAEVLKLALISLALVFAVSAFAIVLLKDDGRESVQPVRTIKLPDPPKPKPAVDKEELARTMWKQKVEELRQQEIAELADRQKRADEAVATLKSRYEKDGKLPDRIVLETPTDRPVPEQTEQKGPTAGGSEAEKPVQEGMKISEPLILLPQEKRIEFDAFVVLDKGQLVEILLAGPRGRLHESLLLTNINPYDLWQALALLGLKQSYTARGDGDMIELEGDRVIIEVEYEHGGEKHRRRVEDLIYNFQLNTHMPYEGWVYVGSHFGEMPDGKVFLLAEKTENIASTWHRATTILDNPLKEGGDDGLYRSYENVVPPAQTKMRVIITPDEKYNSSRKEAQPLTGR